MKKDIELAKSLLEGKGYKVSKKMNESAPVFADTRTSIDIRGLAQVDQEELLNDYAGAIKYKDGVIYADETTIRQIRNDWDLWESKKMNEAGWMVNHPGYDPIGAPAPYNHTTDGEPEPHWVARNRAEIEKERKAQGAPADAIYDGESGYFEDPKNPDHYWDEKAKAYNWVFIDGKGWVNESKKLKETKYIAGYHKNPRGYGTARVDLKTFDTEEEVERYCRMMNYDTGYTDEYGIKRYIDYVVEGEEEYESEEVLKPQYESEDLKYVSNVNGYSTYRKIENGKGVWFAKRQDDPDDKMFPISYEQARGYKEMPDETEIEKLQREMGKMLLPKSESKKMRESAKEYKGYTIEYYVDSDDYSNYSEHRVKISKDGKVVTTLSAEKDPERYIDNLGESKKMRESTDDRQQRRIVKSIADEVIRSKGQNNSTGTYDRFIRKMMDNWATSGQDRDFIKSAIEKSFDKEYGKKGVNESCRPRRRKMRESAWDELDRLGVSEEEVANIADKLGFTDGVSDEQAEEILQYYKNGKSSSESDSFEYKGITVRKEGGKWVASNGVNYMSYLTPRDIKKWIDHDNDNPSYYRESKKMRESSDTPHTESYKGYSIQSYDDYGATVYKNGKKVQEFENIDDAREYIDGLNESDKTLKGALMNSLKRLNESLDYEDMKDWNPMAIASKIAEEVGNDATEEEIKSEIAKVINKDYRRLDLSWVEEDDEELVAKKVSEISQDVLKLVLREIDWDRESRAKDPMNGNHYHIGGSTPNVTEYGTDYDVHDGGYADDPELAIIKWMRLSKNSPMMISIDTNKNAYAQELLQWVLDNEEKFRKLCQKYNCPYKVDYMIDGCKQKLQRPSNFETKYNYPDQIYPFALG